MIKSYTIPILFVISSFFFTYKCSAQDLWSPNHVYYGIGGKLTYTPDERGNIIPDFSNVGYQYGDIPIPEIKTVIEVSPVEGDDGKTIQDAIDSLSKITPDDQGFRGAVLLKSGIYEVSGQIKISVSGIVLRGEGDSEDGTIIVAKGKSDRDLIKIDNGTSRTVHSSTKVKINEDYVPVGRKYVIVADASGFSQDDHIVLFRPASSQWISDIKMNQITLSEGTQQWNASGYTFYFERLITKINGDTIFFRNPVVMAMEKKYGGGFVYKYSFNRLQNIGIENIRLKSAFTSNQDEEHSWNAVAFYSAEHCWVRNVSSYYFAYSCVNQQSKSRLITVENCHCREPKSLITGSRRYSFNISGSLSLVKNCTTTEGRHDFVTGSRITGPNVFTQNSASNVHSDIGPHHRWAMGNLFDVIVTDGAINVQDRDDMGSGHGWSGANTFFWNCKGSSSVCQSPWASAKNYNFGFIGSKNNGYRSGRPDGEWIGHNVPGIFPVSIYEAQLIERLHGTTVFSVLPYLKLLSDTTFLMQFSLPVNPEAIIKENFEISGGLDINYNDYAVSQKDEYSVIITSKKFEKFPDSSKLLIKANQITSLEGNSLQGLTQASYLIKYKGPEVTGVAKITNNVDGFGEASSNKTGYIYLVKFGVNATTLPELDSLIALNLGRKSEVLKTDTFISISAKGLPGGYYQYYAVGKDKRVSLPSSTWIILEEIGPVTEIKNVFKKNSFISYVKNGHLIVNPENENSFSLEVFTITGQRIYMGSNLSGIQSIFLGNFTGVLIIRKSSENSLLFNKISLKP